MKRPLILCARLVGGMEASDDLLDALFAQSDVDANEASVLARAVSEHLKQR